jgi:hypothetical protein
MREFALGEKGAEKLLAACAGNVPKLRKKYFAF